MSYSCICHDVKNLQILNTLKLCYIITILRRIYNISKECNVCISEFIKLLKMILMHDSYFKNTSLWIYKLSK